MQATECEMYDTMPRLSTVVVQTGCLCPQIPQHQDLRASMVWISGLAGAGSQTLPSGAVPQHWQAKEHRSLAPEASWQSGVLACFCERSTSTMKVLPNLKVHGCFQVTRQQCKDEKRGTFTHDFMKQVCTC